jgi:hypothetical protein
VHRRAPVSARSLKPPHPEPQALRLNSDSVRPAGSITSNDSPLTLAR